MIQLEFYNSSHFEELESYKLDEIQAQFTASVYENIVVRKVESNPLKHPITILFDQRPIGFFVLDLSDDKRDYTTEPDSVLLRSLSLNPDFQGKGIGKQAMKLTDEFVKHHFPEVKKIVLSVNFKNTLAYRLYLQAGYVDTKRVFAGIKGAQHILEKRIC